jgi:ABC-type transporter Mla subunit MlaD
MATSAKFTAVTTPDNIHQVIFEIVQQLSTLWYATSAPEVKDTLDTLIGELNDRSLKLLEQEIDTNSQALADATKLLKDSTATAKQAVGNIQKTSQVINGVAQAIGLLDQVLKVAGTV